MITCWEVNKWLLKTRNSQTDLSSLPMIHVSIALTLHKLCSASLILLVSAFTMQTFHLHNREPVSFSSICSRNYVSCLEKSDVFKSFFNLNNYWSSVGQHVFLGVHFTISTKVCRRFSLVTTQDDLLPSAGWTRVIYGLLQALEFSSLDKGDCCKLTKNPYKLVIAARYMVTVNCHKQLHLLMSRTPCICTTMCVLSYLKEYFWFSQTPIRVYFWPKSRKNF